MHQALVMSPSLSSSTWWPPEVRLSHPLLTDSQTFLPTLFNKGHELQMEECPCQEEEGESDMCSSEVNFYFLADRTLTPILLPAPFTCPSSGSLVQRVPWPRGLGVISHSKLEE